MKKLRPDPYPNPIDIKRHPSLAGLDEDLKRSASGLPIALSSKDKQFLDEAKTWLQEKGKREESNRVFASLEKKQQTQQRQVSNVRQRKSNDRPRSFNHFLSVIRAERYEQEIEEDKMYEEEQIRLEKKWLSQRNNADWSY